MEIMDICMLFFLGGMFAGGTVAVAGGWYGINSKRRKHAKEQRQERQEKL